MLGFEPIPKPVCGEAFEDCSYVVHTCQRAAPYWIPWHIHRSHQVWFISFWFFGRPVGALYFLRKAAREADLAALTEARRRLERNNGSGQYDALNAAVIEAEKRVLFGKHRGWKYEART